MRRRRCISARKCDRPSTTESWTRTEAPTVSLDKLSFLPVSYTHLDVYKRQYYLLLSGRWFSSKSLDGPWSYERGDQLPSSFKKIAPASPIGDALAAVPGTNEAEDAVIDSEIPQTAAIKRSEAKTEVSYDGDPQFQDIPSTDRCV